MNILIATDNSPNAMACIDALKNRSFSKNTFVHVISVYGGGDYNVLKQGLTKDQALEAVTVVVEKLQDSVDSLTSEVKQGHPAEMILEVVDNKQIDMLFVGAHAKSIWQSAFIGNVAQTILEKCQCSITIVKTGLDGNYKQEKRHLICVDSTVGDADSWIHKKAHLWQADEEFLLLSIVEPPIDLGSENPKIDAKIFVDGLKNKRVQMQQLVDREVAHLKNLYSQAKIQGCLLEDIDVSTAILRLARSWQADLIVMHPHRRKGIDKFLIGSVSQEVARNAQCSVEIVH